MGKIPDTEWESSPDMEWKSNPYSQIQLEMSYTTSELFIW